MPEDPTAGLTGRRVLLLRPAGRGAGLVERLRDLGAEVVWHAAIDFAPPSDGAAVDRALDLLPEYAWIVVTSPTGVAWFERRARERGAAVRPSSRFAAVGPGTARALGRAGFSAAVIASRADADGLAEALAPHIVRGERALVVRPEVGRDVVAEALRGAGATVDQVAFYRTVGGPSAAAAADVLARRRCDVVVFSSPSTLRFVLEAPGVNRSAVVTGLAGIKRVAIGAVTAAALARAGVAADAVADAPEDAAVVNAILAVWYDPGRSRERTTPPPRVPPAGASEGDP